MSAVMKYHGAKYPLATDRKNRPESGAAGQS